MKKIIVYILFVVQMFVAQGAVGVVYAQTSSTDKPAIGEYLPNFSSKDIAADRQELSGNPSDRTKQETSVYGNWLESLQNIANLPKGSPESIIAGVISIILGLGGTLAFISMLVAGVMYIIAHDNEDLTQKAKKLLIYSIIGLVLISISFAIFTGLATIVFA